MAKYIDFDKLMEAIEKDIEPYKSWDCTKFDVVMDTILEAPTADVVEVKHGEWILRRQSNGVKVHQCSVCGRPIYTIDEDLKDYAPYCHCGAKMDGERK